MEQQMWVITWDNGSGYREWASHPQLTEQAAWEAADLKPGEQYFPGSDPKLEVFANNSCNCGWALPVAMCQNPDKTFCG